jgi:Fe-S oxidoreductase
MEMPLVRLLNERLLGIDRRRLPPPFARRRLSRRQFRHLPTEGTPAFFFPDTFTQFHEPEVGRAAIELLSRAGCAVSFGLPRGRLRCCGRPLISNGLLGKAVQFARFNVERLYPFAEQGQPIVACEPSCILTIKDDYPALLRGAEQRRARVVAAACRTFEELLDERVGQAFLAAGATADRNVRPTQILVQGHCHQQALVGMAPTQRLLSRIPEAKVTILDAGCCGMAGSFGYELEHYEVSRLVGEQRLFPALRQAPPDTVIVAPGFSCRMQIQHFTGRKAVHPAELLRSFI